MFSLLLFGSAMKQFKTNASIFHVDTHGIIHKSIIEGVNYTQECAKEDQEMLLKLSKDRKALVIVHSEAFYTMTPEGIDDLTATIKQSRQATAIVSTSLGVRIFVDTVNAITKNSQAFRMFETEKEGLKWLLAFKKPSEKRTHNPAIAPKIHNRKSALACDVSIDSHGILVKKIYEGAHINLAIAKQAEKQAAMLAGNRKVLALVDRSASYTITKGAARFLEQNINSKQRMATALVFPGYAQHASVAKTKANQLAPVKVFSNKTSAVKWLLSLKKPANHLRRAT